MVDIEFKKRNSYLHVNIDKSLSELAAQGLASSGVENTGNTVAVSKILGHADIKTTTRLIQMIS